MPHSTEASTNRTVGQGYIDGAYRRSNTKECVTGVGETCWCCAINTIARKEKAEVSFSLKEGCPFTFFVVGMTRRTLTHSEIKLISENAYPPPLRNQPQLALDQPIREQCRRLGVQDRKSVV